MSEQKQGAKAAGSTPPAAAVVVSEETVFSIMDRLDEDAVLTELSGRVVESYVYEIEVWDPDTRRKKKQLGLSKVGVDAVCRHLAEQNVMVREMSLDVTVDHQREEALFIAKAGRWKTHMDKATGQVTEVLMDTAIGTKRQPMRHLKSGGGLGSANPHWYETGATKALRNARRRLIPEAVVLELLGKWQGEGRVKQVAVQRPVDGVPDSETTAEEAREALKQEAQAEDIRQGVLADLERLWGPGPPWENPHKLACVRGMFGTGQWPQVERAAPAIIIRAWDREKWGQLLEAELAKEQGAEK